MTLQRVLKKLVDSGARDRVKPVWAKPAWLRRVLDAQTADGGRSGMQPLLPLGDGGGWASTSGDGRAPHLFIGFNQRGAGEPCANFHTTAQGVLLLSLLLHAPAR